MQQIRIRLAADGAPEHAALLETAEKLDQARYVVALAPAADESILLGAFEGGLCGLPAAADPGDRPRRGAPAGA